MGKGAKTGVAGASLDAAQKMFMGSSGARRAMFSTLASALRTGGRGMKGGLVHMGIARSREAGTAALANASSTLGSMDAGMRGRVMNRISRQGMAETAGVGPGLAQAFIGKAPGAIFGGAAAQNEAYRVGAMGEGNAMQAAATRAAGITQAGASVAAPLGAAVGKSYADKAQSAWFAKYFKPAAP